jgi:hypothetical protein
VVFRRAPAVAAFRSLHVGRQVWPVTRLELSDRFPVDANPPCAGAKRKAKLPNQTFNILAEVFHSTRSSFEITVPCLVKTMALGEPNTAGREFLNQE